MLATHPAGTVTTSDRASSLMPIVGDERAFAAIGIATLAATAAAAISFLMLIVSFPFGVYIPDLKRRE
jgi:hypothetical protein